MDFEQDTVSLPRRGDLPLLRAVDSKMYLNQQCVINKCRLPQNCMHRCGYQDGYLMQFFAMTNV